jgi:signal transduction histidine kinase
MNTLPIISVELLYEQDVVSIRQRARQIAGLLEFVEQDQVRIATATSEIARNVFQYAKRGRAEFSIRLDPPQALTIVMSDRGPGIADLASILEGTYRSTTGMGLGISGAKKLVDRMDVQTSSEGTRVTLQKFIPRTQRNVTTEDVIRITDHLVQEKIESPIQQVQVQNRELFHALQELQEKQKELEYVNAELEDTNRGVLALYTELDEKAVALRRASEAKTAFLSNMTHEFRSPLNSILNIANLLLEGPDAVRDEDHEKQLSFIRKSALALSDLVNDLLDIARIEAGKMPVRVSEFTSEDLLGTMRGLMKPLLRPNADVELLFDEPQSAFPPFETDEGKLSQILRNFISNALKFTPKGSVRVRVDYDSKKDVFTFEVADTGIGIPREDQDRIFEEFEQVDSPLHGKEKGTGLGLPLTRKLASLLGGSVELESEIGKGSTFRARIPRKYQGEAVADYFQKPQVPAASLTRRENKKALVIDDEEPQRIAIRGALLELGYTPSEASEGTSGIERAVSERPGSIVLDLSMPGLDGYEVMKRLLGDPRTASIPVVICTSRDLDPEELHYFRQMNIPVVKKVFDNRARFVEELASALAPRPHASGVIER